MIVIRVGYNEKLPCLLTLITGFQLSLSKKTKAGSLEVFNAFKIEQQNEKYKTYTQCFSTLECIIICRYKRQVMVNFGRFR